MTDHRPDRPPRAGRPSPAESPVEAAARPRPPPGRRAARRPPPSRRRPAPAAAAGARRTPVVGPVSVADGGRRRGEPRTYDFRRPTKLSREHVRVLQIAQEAFARQATTILTTLLRAGARLELVGIEQFSYDDYIVTLPEPGLHLHVHASSRWPARACSPTRSTSRWPSSTTCSAARARADQPNRPMTAMETTITSHLLERLLDEFADDVRARSPRSSRSCSASSTTRSWPRPPRARTPSWSPRSRWRSAAARARPRSSCRSRSFAAGAEQRRLPAAVGLRAGQAQAGHRGPGRPAEPRAGRRRASGSPR